MIMNWKTHKMLWFMASILLNVSRKVSSGVTAVGRRLFAAMMKKHKKFINFCVIHASQLVAVTFTNAIQCVQILS